MLEVIKILLDFQGFSFGRWMPSMSVQLEGGVGHIVAATLQTKGIIDQAKILENLTELNSIASLFYLFAVAMAIGSVAMFGNYRQGIYLLIGPTLYTFMVTTTVETNGSVAKMGSYEIPNSIGRQTEFLKHIRSVDDNGGTKKVSLAYALVDGIATEVVQEITQLLVNTDNRDHLRFVARERALSYLLLDMPMDGVLPLLVSRHQAECSYAIQNYIQSGVDTKKLLNSGSQVRSDGDVAKIKAEGDKAWGDDFGMFFSSGADYEIKRYLKSMAGEPGFDGININDPKQGYWASCKNVWKWIGASFQARAKRAYQTDYHKGENESAPESSKEEVLNDTKEAIPVDYLAVHMYKNVLGHSSNSQLQSQLFGTNVINQQDLSVAMRDAPGAYARGGYFAMKYFAASIPYIQGLLLYILSIAFPFFAILLVVPGKAMQFMMWVSLWVWVKSWDVGFALVLVCKDMFWHILKHRNNTFDETIDWGDPSSVFSVILNNDPLATQNLYFELSSFLTVSVPFLTAHFCLGATGMFEMFRNSIDQTSQRFKTWENKSSMREILNTVERDIPRLQAGLGQMAGNMALGSEATGQSASGFNPRRGAQDMAGRAIAQDTRKALFSRENAGMIVGGRALHTMAVYKWMESMVAVGNQEYRGQYKREMSQLDNFERSANMMVDPKNPNREIPLPANAKMYALPEGAPHIGPTVDPNKTSLDEAVPAKVLEKYAEDSAVYNDKNSNEEGFKRRGAIDVNREWTWGEFMKADAREKGERIVLPHVFRGMPRLEAEVSLAQMKELDGFVGSLGSIPGGSKLKTLIKDAEKSGEPVILDKLIEAAHSDYTHLISYTGGLSGRHYGPPYNNAVGNAKSAMELSMQVSMEGRVLEVGTAKDSSENLSNPFLNMIYEKLFDADTDTINRPGVRGDGKGVE